MHAIGIHARVTRTSLSDRKTWCIRYLRRRSRMFEIHLLLQSRVQHELLSARYVFDSAWRKPHCGGVPSHAMAADVPAHSLPVARKFTLAVRWNRGWDGMRRRVPAPGKTMITSGTLRRFGRSGCN